MNKNIAVIGCGHWGKNLVRNFSRLGALKSICDPDESTANALASKYSVEVSSFEKILTCEETEALVLAVPAPMHFSMAMDAMKHGKHVYVEKPLALDQDEAKQMIKASQDYGLHLMVGHLLQYHPIFIKFKELVKKGSIGNLNYVYSNRLSLGKIRSEEDVIWSFAPHDISMILSLTDQEPRLIYTESTAILQSDIADLSTIHLSFESGLKAHIHVSWINPYKEQKIVAIGDQAMIIFDDTKDWDEKLSVYNHKIDFSQETPLPIKDEVQYISVPESEPLRNECQYFIDLIEGKVAPLTDGNEGLSVLKVLNAASESQYSNKKININ